jgi:hypothetical protein
LAKKAASFHGVFKHGLEPGALEMTKTIEKADKALVLETFRDTFQPVGLQGRGAILVA